MHIGKIHNSFISYLLYGIIFYGIIVYIIFMIILYQLSTVLLVILKTKNMHTQRVKDKPKDSIKKQTDNHNNT